LKKKYFLNEGVIFGDKITTYYESLEALVKLFPKIKSAADKYLAKLKKEQPDEYESSALYITIKVESMDKAKIKGRPPFNMKLTVKLWDDSIVTGDDTKPIEEFETNVKIVP